MSFHPLPRPGVPERPAATGAGAFFRTLAGELRAAPASPAKPRFANDNGQRPACA